MLGQQGRGIPSLLLQGDGQILALVAFQNLELIHFHALGLGKSQGRLGGVALVVKGDPLGRTGDGLAGRLAFFSNILDQQG